MYAVKEGRSRVRSLRGGTKETKTSTESHRNEEKEKKLKDHGSLRKGT